MFCGCVFNQFCTAPILDEIWVHHYEPAAKAQSMAWKRPTSPVSKKFKSRPSAGKIMLTFWGVGEYVRCDFGAFHSKGSRSRPQQFPYVWPTEEKF
jgi:hypothetical protein